MKKLFLLDAYALIYRAYYAFIRVPRINSKGQNTSAILGFVNTLEEVLRRENPDYIGVVFDPKGGTFRHKLYPAYKAQREETPEDIRFAIPYIKSIIEGYRIPVIEVENYEADDVIGTLAKRFASDSLEVYMMTPDKDYGQLVDDHIWMYRPGKGDTPFELLGPKEVCEKYGIDNPLQVIDLLGLMGDSSDNIPGCPGVGEKTAVKLIKEFGSVENLLDSTASLKGKQRSNVEENHDQIVLSKFLATIKTDVPVDIELESLKKEEKDVPRLSSLFDELEFRSLSHRLLQGQGGGEETFDEMKPKETVTRRKKNSDSGMMDLFGSSSSSDAGKNEKAVFSQNDAKKTENTPSRSGNLPDLWSNSSEFATLDDIKTTPHQYYLVENEADIKELAQKFLSEKFLSLDTETTSTNSISAELVGLSFSVKEHEAYYVPIPSEFEEALKIVNFFKPVYESEEILKIGQNIKYDINVLSKYGVEVKGRMFDTMLAHYVLHPELRHNMDYLSEIYLKYKTIHIDELIGEKKKGQKNMRDLAASEVYEYAAEDADVTLCLKNKLEKELEETGMTQLFEEIEMPLVPVLGRMERNGVVLDTDSLRQVSEDFGRKMSALEESIYELAGERFNISSPKQVGELLFDRLKIVSKAKKTKTGQYVTSEDVLQNLKGKHPVIEKILSYRGYKKLLSTYIDNLPNLINPKTGHIHTSYNQAVTTTGRLSSSDPNLQNIPIRDANGKEVRKAFVAELGCLFFSADYSQIELRLMAHLSEDEHMISAFLEGHDIHRATAAKIYKKSLDEVSSDERRKAKTANFGIIYGITTFGLAERMEVSRSEAKELIDGYFETYPKVKEYMEESVNKARELGYTETLFGRRCYLPDINSHNATVRGYAERNAINAPIQGTAADIIKKAMIAIDRRMQEEGVRSKMILQVHDELNFNVVPEEKELMERLVIEEMEKVVSLRVPLVADCGWGENWLEAH